MIDKTQLFDLLHDPHEMKDLAGDVRYAGKIDELLKLLRQALRVLGDRAPLKVTNPKPAEWSPPAG